MKHWKPLRKRGLALFLVLMMCVSMFPTAAFAVEGGHVHNDSCVQGELTCPYDEHEHGEECYAAEEPQCGETEHEHDAEACYDENGDLACILDEHEHGEECYVAEEPQCGKTEHKHDESCYAWDCPQDEEDQEPEETQETEESQETEVPAEVQDFLDAVAALPGAAEVTPANAEAIGDDVDDVLDLYDALDVEFCEREDVNEALETVYAVYEAVLAAEEIDDVELYATNINVWNHTLAYVKQVFRQELGNVLQLTGASVSKGTESRVTLQVGEKTPASLQIPTNGMQCPNCYYLFGGGKRFTPTKYCEMSGIDSSNLVTTEFKKADDTQYVSQVGYTEYMQMDVTGQKPGTSNISVSYYCNFEMYILNSSIYGDNGSDQFRCSKCYSIVEAYNDATWHRYSHTVPVTVNADYLLNFNANGGTVDPASMRQTVASTSCSFTLPTPTHPDGKTFLGWAETADATTGVTGSYTLNWSEGYGSTSNPVEKTLYAIWEGDDTAPEAPLHGHLHSLLGNFVEVQCVSDGNGLPHDAKTYSVIGNWNDATIGPVYQDEGKYKVDVTLDGAIYAQFYGFDPAPGTGVTHTLKAGEAATRTITLTWNPEKPAGVNNEYQHWDSGEDRNIILATFQVVCKPEPKGEITGFNKKLVKNAEAVPDGVSTTGITFPDSEGKVTRPADGASVTLLYTITVTGTPGAKYKVTDTGADWVSGPSLGVEYTLGDTGTAVIYVKRTFTEADLDNGNLVNVAKVEPGTGSNTSTTSSETTPTKTAPSVYKLIYDANGGTIRSNGDSATTMTHEASYAPGGYTFTVKTAPEELTGFNPTRKGYTLLGWADTKDATAVQYQAGDEIKLTETAPTKTIYAVWQPGKPTADEVNKEVSGDPTGKTGAVDVFCQPGPHQVGHFAAQASNGRITIGEVVSDGNGGYTCDVTFVAQKFCDAYNTLKSSATNADENAGQHTLVSGQVNRTIKFQWDAENSKWVLPAGVKGPLEFYVECPETTFKYRLEYELNEGKGDGFTPMVSGTTKETSHEFTLSSAAPTLAGKIFVGWADSQEDANAGIVSYGKGGKVTVTSTDTIKEVGDITYRCKTVYAVWVSTSEVGIGVTKTIQKQITGTDGSTGWRDLKDDEALKNGDVVRYTVKVQNTSEALSLTDLTLFDDMDRKLTDVKNIKISKGRTATSQYYAATEEESPLLYFEVEGELEVNDTYTVWYEATVQNADGKRVENTATAYAEVVPELAARSVQYGTSASTGAGAESDGQVDVDSGVGTGDRPTRPSGGVSGSGNNGANTETDQPSLSVTKTAKVNGEAVTADTKAKVGDVISYVVTVKNTGNVTLTGVTVEDSMSEDVVLTGTNSFDSFDLAVGAEHQISYTYTVKATDVGGNVVNTVTVSHPDITTPVTATKTVQVPAPDTFTVTFNANGGKWEDNALTKAVSSIAANGTVGNQMPADPAYANYRFTGWNTQSDGSGTAFTGDTPVTGNITVYAQWQEKEDAAVTYPEFQDEDGDGEPDKLPEDTTDDVEAGVKIIVNPNGGAWTPTDPDKWTESGDTFNRTAQEGEKIALTPDPVKDGSVFMGWKKEVSDDGTTITFTAQWEEDKYGPTDDDDPTKKDEGDGIPDSWQYTVTYVAIGGTVTPASTVVTKLDESGKPSATGTAKLADKHLPTTQPNKGYGNGTWNVEPKADTVITEDTTFTITYTQFTVTVQPDNDEGGTWTNGTTEPDVKTPNDEGKVTLPGKDSVTPPANKELDKWVDQNDTEYQPGQVIEPDKDLTLKPVWKDIIPDEVIVSAASVTATYDGQGHPVTGVTVTKNGKSVTPSSYNITYNGTGTTAPVNAGTYTATITAVVDGQTVTGTAVVTINRRPVTITSNSASRVYNGSALTNHSVTVGGQGFVAGQGATYAFTGTQTAVGSSSNYFTYSLNAGTLAANYSITTSLGTLRVTSAGGGGSTTSGGGGGGGSRPSTSPTRPGSSTTTISDTDVPLAGDLQLNKTDHFAYIKGYQDGTVRPNNPITRAQVATIFYRLLDETSRVIYFQETNDFTDVANDYWANKAISTLTNAGIITGFSDGTFRPNANITRAQFAAIAARFDNVVPGLNNPFTDVAEDYWARDLIAFAADRGWITGNGGKFRPLENITRVEVMDFINNVLERHVDEEGLLENATKWSDVPVTDPNYYVVEEATNSHDYTRRTDGQLMENWTKLNPDPVWDE